VFCVPGTYYTLQFLPHTIKEYNEGHWMDAGDLVQDGDEDIFIGVFFCHRKWSMQNIPYKKTAIYFTGQPGNKKIVKENIVCYNDFLLIKEKGFLIFSLLSFKISWAAVSPIRS